VLSLGQLDKSDFAGVYQMVLWTIQHLEAYEKMEKCGTLRANREHLLFDGYFIDAYRWMSEKMTEKIGAAPDGIEFPVWAWFQWEGKRKRPDMRLHGRGGEKGVPIVLLTIDVPEESVLLSDFDYWHFVLNDSAILPYSDTMSCSEQEKRGSWENIFDITCSFDGEEHPSLSTQATVWEIKKEWVKKAEHFISR
jgi:hypothetical protein